MKNISLNFFGEEISINMPTTLSSLRQEISDKFMFSPSDAAEVVLSYVKDFVKKFIETEQDFANFIANKIGKIDLDISQDSKLYKKNLDTLQKESEEAKKDLELCLKKKEELKKEKHACLKEETAQLKEVEKKIKQLLKEKKKIQKKINQDKKKFHKEEKENNKKISSLKEKLGIKEEKSEKKEKSETPKEKISPKKTVLKTKKVVKLRGKKKEQKEQKEVHTFVTCDGCKMNPLVGKRYKCECCPNFDFCEKCYKNKKEAHGHSFKQVSTDILLKQILDKFSPKHENAEGKPIHHMYSCDGCGMSPIVGNRYKCSVCDNFDYCEKCEAIYKNQHNHQFLKVSKPNMNI